SNPLLRHPLAPSLQWSERPPPVPARVLAADALPCGRGETQEVAPVLPVRRAEGSRRSASRTQHDNVFVLLPGGFPQLVSRLRRSSVLNRGSVPKMCVMAPIVQLLGTNPVRVKGEPRAPAKSLVLKITNHRSQIRN